MIMYIPTLKDLRSLLNAGSALGGEPTGGSFKMWFWGVGIAAIPIVYGTVCLFTGRASILGRGGESAVFRGAEAAGLAIGYISVGAFLHFRYFWGLHKKLCEWYQFLAALSILGVVGSCVYIFYRLLFR
jgi:hypothetical protein